jgi:hypothetical protein
MARIDVPDWVPLHDLMKQHFVHRLGGQISHRWPPL